ncbi:MAG: hypothetical protein EA412_14700 [Chitinophagaceae bacterium]|nr:MAG: hypothetical protein EA412_14700 [Chitinophagaceae bacterium]
MRLSVVAFHKVKLFIIFFTLVACNKESVIDIFPSPAYQITKTISYNGVSVDIVIDKPEGDEFNVLMVFHGTVAYDSLIIQAANNTLNGFKNILDRDDWLILSVAYPEEGLLFGDNIEQCEAALLWLKNEASGELQINIQKIFLAGHSQGGYLVTRLNTMHETDGVIANAPGPLNLVFRCKLEENGQIPSGLACSLLDSEYGPPSLNPNPYYERSLLNYTSGHKSDILFIQGLNDSPIQMHSWPLFREELLNCNNCQSVQFVELQGFGHNALFSNSQAKTEFNNFINSR